jgi:hypothetical protein
MATIGSEIAKLKLKLASLGYDDDNVLASDEALYNLLNDAGAIIYKRIRDKFNKIPDYMYSTFGVKLTEVNEDVYACEDIPDRCKILESEFELPLVLYGRNTTSLKVYAGKQELSQYSVANQYDDYLSTRPSYAIQNRRLRIYNDKVLKAVTVKAVWADILDWADKQYCDGVEVECLDLLDLPFPLYSNPEYTSMAHDVIIQSLNLTIQNSNDQNPQH